MIRGLVLAGVAVTLLTAAAAEDAGEGAGYEGEVNESGLPHGEVMTWPDGRRVEGQFREFIGYYMPAPIGAAGEVACTLSRHSERLGQAKGGSDAQGNDEPAGGRALRGRSQR